MNFFAISTLVTSVTSLMLGVFVLNRNKNSSLNRNWATVCFLLASWSLGLWGVITATSENMAWNYQYILDLSAIFIPIFYFKFVLYLLNLQSKKRFELIGVYAFSFILAYLSFSPLFKIDMNAGEFGFNYWVRPGPLYVIFPAYFALLLFYSFYILYSNLNKSVGLVKNQIKYILAAGIVGFVGGSTNFFPQVFGFYPIGNYFVILYAFFVAYAIIKYRLMGIRLLISKFYTYGLIAAFAFILTQITWRVNSNFLGGPYTAVAYTFSALVAMAYSVLLLPFINYVQKSSDTLFFKGYNPRAIIKDLTIRLSSVIEINELIKILAGEFKKILLTEEVGVIIFYKNGEEETGKINGNFSVKKAPAKNMNRTMYFNSGSVVINCANIKRDSIICLDAVEKQAIIVRNEIKTQDKDSQRQGLAEEMDKYKVEVIAPLVIGGKVTGLIVLGEKISQDGYTQEDIEFLEIISSQAAVAIDNALLYKEIGEMNRNLQKKVEAKTAELREQNEYLKKLMDMRSEFLDVASHQLRTPVSVIRGMSSMILEGGMKKEEIDKFMHAMYDKSTKLAEIINDILRASEMDSEKQLLKFSKVDLNKLLTKLVEDKQIQSKEKEISLKINLPKKPLPLINGDERYLEQAIGNLINNSLQYTLKGGQVEVIPKLNEKKLEIRVRDTGIGIPAEDMPKLFNKFSRAKNAVEAFTDGTGLGLFIVKRIIEGHKGGKVIVEKTELGKGTTFLISLAVN